MTQIVPLLSIFDVPLRVSDTFDPLAIRYDLVSRIFLTIQMSGIAGNVALHLYALLLERRI